MSKKKDIYSISIKFILLIRLLGFISLVKSVDKYFLLSSTNIVTTLPLVFSFINIDSLMLRAFDNLLPHIQIQKIEYRENPNKFTRRLVNSYNRLSDRLNNKR